MNKKILVVNGGYSYCDIMKPLGEVSEDIKDFMKNPEMYKLVLFTGGEDVCPSLYKHSSPNNMCYYNLGRDLQEEIIFAHALENDIAMTGICRGSQFLNVMCGGWLMHHITNHGSSHSMTTITGHEFRVTSTHHQMCVPTVDGFVLGWSTERRSKDYFGNNDKIVDYDGPEVENIYYPAQKVFAVQYHPEMMETNSDGYRWFQTGVDALLTLNETQFKAKYFGNNVKSLTNHA